MYFRGICIAARSLVRYGSTGGMDAFGGGVTGRFGVNWE
jgi:hypothetical protein